MMNSRNMPSVGPPVPFFISHLNPHSYITPLPTPQGAMQIPLHIAPTPPDVPFRGDSLDIIPRLPCATLLVRLLSPEAAKVRLLTILSRSAHPLSHVTTVTEIWSWSCPTAPTLRPCPLSPILPPYSPDRSNVGNLSPSTSTGCTTQ